MKQVKTNGVKGWQFKIKELYIDFQDCKDHCELHSIHKRLGFKSVEKLWDQNPTIKIINECTVL